MISQSLLRYEVRQMCPNTNRFRGSWVYWEFLTEHGLFDVFFDYLGPAV